MDALQQQVAHIAEMASQSEDEDPSNSASESPSALVGNETSPFAAFHAVECAAFDAAGRQPPILPAFSAYYPRPPRLTEHWFC